MACKWPDPALGSLVPLMIVSVGGVVVAALQRIGDEPEPLTCAVAVVKRVDCEPKSSVPQVAPATGALPLIEQAPARVIVALMTPFTLTACVGIDTPEYAQHTQNTRQHGRLQEFDFHDPDPFQS